MSQSSHRFLGLMWRSEPHGDSESEELALKIRWLLLLRVVIVSFFLGATALFHFVRTEGDLAYLVDLSIPLIGAYGISVGSAWVLPRLANLRPFAHAQVAFDVILITGIIWITGDLSSPFSFLYNLAVMNAAILLFYRGAYFAAVFSSLSYASLLGWSLYPHLRMNGYLSWSMLFPIVQSIASYFLIAGLGGFLTSKLRVTEKLLKEQQDDYHELDALKDALLQGIASGVAILDSEGRIDYFNRQAQALTTLDASAIRGKRLTDIFPDLPVDFQRKNGIGATATNELSIGSLHKEVRLTIAPLRNARAEMIGYVSILDDITKQRRIEEKVRVEEELRKVRQFELAQNSGNENGFRFEGVVGKSGGMEKIYQLVGKVAGSTTNVLISGESGTGKEIIARSIHLNGARRERPFVAVNCGAIPDSLMESEFFGHVRGAFTGAVSDHSGLFKQADQGTIFLDEVGELPLHLQVKLLRILQEKSFTPIGGSKPIKVDVRVISATNKDLRKELDEGRFREDLFYRLNVVHMVMPPLRSRRDDIPSLAQYFLKKFAVAHGKRVQEISGNALLRLINHSYPGNVRELENIIEHAVTVAATSVVGEGDLPQYLDAAATEAVAEREASSEDGESFFKKGVPLDTELESHEKRILLAALKRAGGVQKRAAELLGINYRSLRHRLEKYEMLGSSRTEAAEALDETR